MAADNATICISHTGTLEKKTPLNTERLSLGWVWGGPADAHDAWLGPYPNDADDAHDAWWARV